MDFGRGFYVTSYQKQAEKWALRKSLRQEKPAVVNVYEMADNRMAAFNMLTFEDENEKWLDFVCVCRKGEDRYQKYDIIIGNVANDDVFKTVDMYFKGLWDKERALKELRYYKMNDQICIVSQKALDRLSKQIAEGKWGIENLDYKYLAEDLVENESELFAGME